jgi:hypothetical protein
VRFVSVARRAAGCVAWGSVPLELDHDACGGRIGPIGRRINRRIDGWTTKRITWVMGEVIGMAVRSLMRSWVCHWGLHVFRLSESPRLGEIWETILLVRPRKKA